MKHPGFEILQDYFENALDAKTESRVKAHLNQCDQCTEVLAQFAVIENQVKSAPALKISQQTEAKIILGAASLLKAKREKQLSRENFKIFIQDWKENIFPEIRMPALQLCSVSLVLAAIVAIEKIDSTEEVVFEPLSSDVHVIRGDES